MTKRVLLLLNFSIALGYSVFQYCLRYGHWLVNLSKKLVSKANAIRSPFVDKNIYNSLVLLGGLTHPRHRQR